jgi:hypothetical protein
MYLVCQSSLNRIVDCFLTTVCYSERECKYNYLPNAISTWACTKQRYASARNPHNLVCEEHENRLSNLEALEITESASSSRLNGRRASALAAKSWKCE